jgi:hypothetical protein
VLFALSLLSSVTLAAGQERTLPAPKQDASSVSCYLCAFAYETTPRHPRLSHTFFAFVRTDGRSFEVHTVSWLPQTNSVRLLRRSGEPGMNLDLQRTIENARSVQAQLYCVGAYQIRPELYERALWQIARLNSGRILFKAVEKGEPPDRTANCISAISGMVPERGPFLPGTNHGRDASELLVEHLSPWIINRDQQHRWLLEKLGLPRDVIEQK